MNVSLNTTQPTCCNSLNNAGQWLRTQAGSFAASAKNVGSAVYDFFARQAVNIGAFLNAAKNTICASLRAARDTIVAAPKEAKVVALIALVATAVGSALLYRAHAKNSAEANLADAINNGAVPQGNVIVNAAAVDAPAVDAPAVDAPAVDANVAVVGQPVVGQPALVLGQVAL